MKFLCATVGRKLKTTFKKLHEKLTRQWAKCSNLTVVEFRGRRGMSHGEVKTGMDENIFPQVMASLYFAS